MRWCCPRAHGCNSSEASERCALELCGECAEEVSEAALALERWGALQRACEHRHGERERRFRRRAYERARDRALVALALHSVA